MPEPIRVGIGRVEVSETPRGRALDSGCVRGTGAVLAAECLAARREVLTPEHALHVLEIITK